MKTEIKKKWLAALRSGKYQQGEFALRKVELTEDEEGNFVEAGEKFCCLGVLCDIVEPKKWEKYDEEDWTNGNEDGPGFPRDELMEKLGLNKPVSRSGKETLAEKLACMNDEGKSFKVIANWIEKKL